VGLKDAKSAIALLLTAMMLTSCAGNTGLEGIFSADPNTGLWAGGGSQNQLPPDFPAELRYPNARLVAVDPGTGQAGNSPNLSSPNLSSPNLNNPSPNSLNLNTTGLPPLQRTRWTTEENRQTVKDFYLELFRGVGWQLQPESAREGSEVLIARKGDLQAVVAIAVAAPQVQPADPTGTPTGQATASPSPTGASNQPLLTSLNIQYARGVSSSVPQPTILGSAQVNPDGAGQPTDPNLVGPTPSVSPSIPLPPAPQQFNDLSKAPQDLQTYLQDVAQLGVLTNAASPVAGEPATLFSPNQLIDRRTFARWLVQVNNRVYRDRPARQIRLAPTSDTPTFRDVPATDPDFPYIQGLAQAGYIPSSLMGNTTSTLFRPNATLTREDLLQWKVPVDLRQNLPTATLDGVKQAWGFKDANRIAPDSLQAVLADYENGDLSNIRRLFGSTLLLQPKKSVTRAEAAASLWYIGGQGDGFSAQDLLRNEQQARANASQTGGNQPSAVQPSVAQPTVAQPTIAEPTVAQPSIAQPSINAPSPAPN
jgi:hypothetical protein